MFGGGHGTKPHHHRSRAPRVRVSPQQATINAVNAMRRRVGASDMQRVEWDYALERQLISFVANLSHAGNLGWFFQQDLRKRLPKSVVSSLLGGKLARVFNGFYIMELPQFASFKRQGSFSASVRCPLPLPLRGGPPLSPSGGPPLPLPLSHLRLL